MTFAQDIERWKKEDPEFARVFEQARAVLADFGTLLLDKVDEKREDEIRKKEETNAPQETPSIVGGPELTEAELNEADKDRDQT